MDLVRLLNWKVILEILILWIVIYRIFLFLKGTKAVYLLRGIIILVISLLLFQMFGLPVLTRILTYLFAFFLILIVIIFQPELREGLTRLGQRHIFHIELKKEDIEKSLREIVSGVGVLSRKKIGALIAIKREMGLKKFIESGLIVNAELSSELLQNIFYPSAPLHDGGVIVEGTKIVATSCLFPLSDNPGLGRTLGMRHRAAVGLSENTDALVIIVSEENGFISLAINGQLTRNLTPNDLFTILKGQLTKP
ncbi:MAG: TIGR00159 family protein [Candidatus Omnitrophica bacterium]|nr:TIGR00159 family protein [Candidatus Omnitrophota bacterium]MBD3268682.1 TIGR00159 family protein [Candidatus Omnitrophota bacterium]